MENTLNQHLTFHKSRHMAALKKHRIASLDSAAAVPLGIACPTLPPALDAREFGAAKGGGSDADGVVS